MRTLRTSAAAVVAGVLVMSVAACSSGATPTETAPVASPASSAAADAAFPVTITHHQGETTIEEQPLRIVALDPSYVDATLFLGAELVGYAQYRQNPDAPFAEYLGDVSELTDEAVNVGTIAEPDLEAILALEPDLIVSASVRSEAFYPQLSKIAPTIFSESTGPTWRENVVMLGTALGKQAEAEQLVADYEARAEAIGDAILAERPGLTANLIRFAGGDTARLYSSNSFIGEILTDMGIPRPEGAPDTTESIYVPIAQEQILDVDAELILVSTSLASTAEGEANLAQREQFESNPLWDRLEGEKLTVDDGVFLASVSLQGAHATMTDLAEHFGVDPMLEG